MGYLLGALGALIALGSFALGIFVGKNTGARAGRPVFRRAEALGETEDRVSAEERQRAFDQLLKYSAEDAYGLRDGWKEDERG